MEASAKKSDKKVPRKSYRNVLGFPETDEVSPFRGKLYQLSVFISKKSLRMRLIICLSDTGEGQNLIRADPLYRTWLHLIP